VPTDVSKGASKPDGGVETAPQNTTSVSCFVMLLTKAFSRSPPERSVLLECSFKLLPSNIVRMSISPGKSDGPSRRPVIFLDIDGVLNRKKIL
jgi:hypothetical protein